MLSKTMSTIFTILFLLFLFGVTSYLENAHVEENDSLSGFLTSYSANGEVEETGANEGADQALENIIPVFEDRLVDTQLKDGYIVEEYREYELYIDENGKLLKTVPTSNYNYIRYDINY
ncbi:hypothetical protein [Litchfieldia alkalitelluris]|uniref:hypothetical protein n=1 Tax=Litchfieldia alkalitelluris TaxID=304268 RepID=UPI00099883E8|nr:hypothetical protein [Litchfieldia alkalitelluris]